MNKGPSRNYLMADGRRRLLWAESKLSRSPYALVTDISSSPALLRSHSGASSMRYGSTRSAL